MHVLHQRIDDGFKHPFLPGVVMIEGTAPHICSGDNFLRADVREAACRKQLAGDLFEPAARLQCLCCLGVIMACLSVIETRVHAC